ncbi:site-specific integrase [Acidipila sp. EB88]|uniref:site-specific integrase n=1 Tax=Acidipila sp. EB88 TaxID=2305226 RepID=UPI000F5EEEC4|nr:site-specific integrase [Acidipila sp. EB88]
MLDVQVAAALAAAPDPLLEQAELYLEAAKAPSTLRAYRSDWEHFLGWCEHRGVAALPAEPGTVALYLVALAASHKPATITRRLTSITKAHAIAGHPTPAKMEHAIVAETLQGIRRELGTRQTGKTALVTADLIQVLAHLDEGLGGVRDRALLLVGYSGAFRRSELATFQFEDLAWVDEGAVLTLRRSKTDQAGQGRAVAIPRGSHAQTCPVTALGTWIREAAITGGPLFRPVSRSGHIRNTTLHPDSVGAIVKRVVARAGFDPSAFAGHSLRAGFATQAARNGATAFDIMRQTGHRSVNTVSRYIREAQLFRDSPAGKLGL